MKLSHALLTAFAGLAVLAARPAVAGHFQVKPTRVELTQKGRMASLTLQNRGASRARFHVSVHSWRQGPDGQVKLSKTRELIAHPSLFAVGAGESRSIRIGAAIGAGPVERSYRVVVEELPPMRENRKGSDVSQIRMLTRMSIPVFYQPIAPSVLATVGASVDGGTIVGTVRNRGTMHFRLGRVRARAFDETGHLLFERAIAGWYVLSGDTHHFSLEMPAARCRQIDRIEIRAESERKTWKLTRPVREGSCRSPR